jgi:hypothetical protein
VRSLSECGPRAAGSIRADSTAWVGLYLFFHDHLGLVDSYTLLSQLIHNWFLVVVMLLFGTTMRHL